MQRLAIVIALCIVGAGITPAAAQETESQPGATPSFSPVTWERLLNAADEPENWLMYSGTLDSQHFSGLDQVDAILAEYLSGQLEGEGEVKIIRDPEGIEMGKVETFVYQDGTRLESAAELLSDKGILVRAISFEVDFQ